MKLSHSVCVAVLLMGGVALAQAPTPSQDSAAAPQDAAKQAASSVAQMLRNIADAVEKGGAEASKPEAEAKPQRDSFTERFHIDTLIEQNSIRNWLLMLGALFLGVLAGRVASHVLQAIAKKLCDRGWVVRGEFFESAAGPVNLALVSAGIALGLMQVIPHPYYVEGENGYDVRELQEFMSKAIIFLYAVAGVWYLSNLVGVVEVALLRFTSHHKDSPLDKQLVPIVTKTLRLFVVVLGVLFVAQTVFGADIGAWLAGLGIAGLAVSLAAQDTLKNLFGSLTLLLDKPFRVGERVILKGFDGTVEEINLRAVRVRTAAGHLITIPNQSVVNDPIENPQRRPFIFRQFEVGVTYDTPPAKMDEAVRIIRRLFDEPGIGEFIHGEYAGPKPPRAFFRNFAADSLNIQITYWYFPADWWAYMAHAELFNLRLMQEYEQAGIEFAFPTRTVYLAGDKKREVTLKMLGADLEGKQ